MNSIIIIPSRMNSSRFPGKPLKMLLNKTMIEHCYIRAKMALGNDQVYIASCDTQIKEEVKRIGGNYINTSKLHSRASTRTSEALLRIEKKLKKKFDIIIMYQGDEPLVNPLYLKKMLKLFNNKSTKIVNLIYKTNSLNLLKDRNNVKLVVNKKNEAIYFSRELLPSDWLKYNNYYGYIQTGVIAFRRKELVQFNLIKETNLEIFESVDMNRIIENSGTINVLKTNDTLISVDNAKDLKVAESYLKKDNVFLKYKFDI